jgi:hypothetical protein
MKYREIVSEGRTIVIDGKNPYETESRMYRFYENPARSQVISLAAKHDLRGSTDGSSVYVWDAGSIIHHNAKYLLRHEALFYKMTKLPDGRVAEERISIPYSYNFYVINRKTEADRRVREEWTSSKRCDFYPLDTMTILCVIKGSGPKLEGLTPNFARLTSGIETIQTTRSKRPEPAQSSSSSSLPPIGSTTT